MKTLSLAVGFFASLLFAGAASADPLLDLVPKDFQFKEMLDDDVSMSRSQHVYIKVLNQGNVPFQNTSPMRVAINRIYYTAYVYGPSASGGVLGGPILPGETGTAIISYIPLNTFTHCQKVVAQIDASRSMQFGGLVFNNDANNFVAKEIGNMRLCRIIVNPHPFPYPIPHPIIIPPQ